MGDITAEAHTAGTYSIQSNIEYLTAEDNPTLVPQNIAGSLSLDLVKATLEKIKQTSSNTSLVVKRAEDRSVKTSSGNSLTTRIKNNTVKTSSGNSLVVRRQNDKNGTVTTPVGTTEISSYGPTLTVPVTFATSTGEGSKYPESTVTIWPIGQNGLNGAVPVFQRLS